jgi:hypothetical protein
MRPIILPYVLWASYAMALPAPQESISIALFSSAPLTPVGPSVILTADSSSSPTSTYRDSSVGPSPAVNSGAIEEPPHSTDTVSVSTITRADRTIQMYVDHSVCSLAK